MLRRGRMDACKGGQEGGWDAGDYVSYEKAAYVAGGPSCILSPSVT